jgi:hypothetical protein
MTTKTNIKILPFGFDDDRVMGQVVAAYLLSKDLARRVEWCEMWLKYWDKKSGVTGTQST